jgi:hypothetical protein
MRCYYSVQQLIIYDFKNTMLDVIFEGLSDKPLDMKDSAAMYSVSEHIKIPVHSI